MNSILAICRAVFLISKSRWRISPFAGSWGYSSAAFAVRRFDHWTDCFGCVCGKSGKSGSRRWSLFSPKPWSIGKGGDSNDTGPGCPGTRIPVGLEGADIRKLVKTMAEANVGWGAPRIHGELLKLGIEVSERTVSRLMPKRNTNPSQTWRTFLDNHVRDLVSIDFFTVVIRQYSSRQNLLKRNAIAKRYRSGPTCLFVLAIGPFGFGFQLGNLSAASPQSPAPELLWT